MASQIGRGASRGGRVAARIWESPPMLPQPFVADVIAATSIVDVIGRHVALARAGSVHRGLCPFHTDASPSFTVTEARSTFHCFGCGAHGDAVQFLRQHLGMDFAEAVRTLAQEAGLPLPSAAQAPARAVRSAGDDIGGLAQARAAVRAAGAVLVVASDDERRAMLDAGMAHTVSLAPEAASTAHVAALVRLAERVTFVAPAGAQHAAAFDRWLLASLGAAIDTGWIGFARVDAAGVEHAVARAVPLSGELLRHVQAGRSPADAGIKLAEMVATMKQGMLRLLIVRDYVTASRDALAAG